MIESGQDLKRWTDPKHQQKRVAVLEKVRQELLSPPPAPKRVPRPVKEANGWLVGEVIGLRLLSGNWTLLRVIGHHKDKGGQFAVCELLDWVGEQVHALESIANLSVKQVLTLEGSSSFIKHLGAFTRSRGLIA